MSKLQKAILKCGTHHSPDGTVEVTPQRIRHWADQFAKMTNGGLGIPVGVDHSDDPAKCSPLPLTKLAKLKMADGKARSAANAVGVLNSILPSADGQSAEIILDIRDKVMAGKAETNVVEVSPVILKKYTDGKKRQWDDCFGHVDLVIHPVDHAQTPFKPADAIACSLRIDGGMYRLGEDMAEEGGAADDEFEESEGESENPDLDPGTEVDQAKQHFEAVISRLPALGLALPSDTDEKNFVERLLTALMTHEAKDAKDEEDESEDEEEENPDMAGYQESSPAFAAMSLQSRSAHAFAVKQYRGSLESRVKALVDTGRCTPDEAKKAKEAIGVVKLSITPEGECKSSKVDLWLESRESLPRGAAWKTEERLRMAAEGASEATPDIDTDLAGELTDEQADAIVDKLFRHPRSRNHQSTASA